MMASRRMSAASRSIVEGLAARRKQGIDSLRTIPRNRRICTTDVNGTGRVAGKPSGRKGKGSRKASPSTGIGNCDGLSRTKQTQPGRDAKVGAAAVPSPPSGTLGSAALASALSFRIGLGSVAAAPTSSIWAPLAQLSRSIDTGTFTLAAVDLGTNSFHLVVVRVYPDTNRLEVLDEAKELVQLGSGMVDGVITAEAQLRAVQAFTRICKIAENHGALSNVRAVATSALREAVNQHDVVAKLEAATGVPVEVIAGTEEARLVYLGVLQAIPLGNNRSVTIDIGGGSTEFILGSPGGKIKFATSLKLGHIPLSEMLLDKEGNLQSGKVEDTRRFIRLQLIQSGLLECITSGNYDVAVGSSGTIEAVADLIATRRDTWAKQKSKEEASQSTSSSGGKGEGEKKSKRKQKGVQKLQSTNWSTGTLQESSSFTSEELDKVVEELLRAEGRDQRKSLGCSEKRIDVIVGGAVLLQQIFDCLVMQSMSASPYALREGIVVDFLARILPGFEPSLDVRRSSVINMARRFSPADTEKRFTSALHTARLLRMVYDGMHAACESHPSSIGCKALGHIQQRYWELMEAAAVLHNVGKFINHDGHHKHGLYLVRNSELLLGYSTLEVEIIALLVRYHRKRTPTPSSSAIKVLPGDLPETICVMLALLRVCVGLERCNNQTVEKISVQMDGDTCVLVCSPKKDRIGQPMDISLNLWTARQELEYLDKALGFRTSILDHSEATMSV
mmetsp:Transcript_11897/g.43528  ORF Transcript_11897/g.43528 Transcript_11897/m.43528 type:complete len:732 (+) Transcript_11897:226-2421(+)